MNQRCLWLVSISLSFAIPASYAGVDDALPDFNKVVQEAGVPPRASCETVSDEPASQEDEVQRWDKAGFKNPKVKSWSARELYPNSSGGPTAFTHGLEVTAVVFRNTGFTTEVVKGRIQRMAKVYSQCGIKIKRVKLIESDAPNGWIDVDDPYDLGDNKNTKIARSLPVSGGPVFFYVRSLGHGGTATAQPQFIVGANSPRVDTMWLTSGVLQKKYLDSDYSTEAHELGHVLGNCDHDESESRNFLAADWSLLNGKIREDQCEAMKKHKSVRPL